MNWRQLLQQASLPLHAFFDAEGSSLLWAGDMLTPEGVRARRAVLHGTCMAAATVLPTLRAQRQQGEETPPLVHVDAATARDAFAAARAEPGDLATLLPLFRPTAVLFEENLRGGSGVITLEDGATPAKILLGLAAVAPVRPPALRTLGETFFVPPAVTDEGRARSAWLRNAAIDPPCPRERGGPFWRLGHHGLWRLDVLAWNERLALAALVGTGFGEALCLAPGRLLPRVGYVLEMARQMGRTIVHVPLDACPKEWRGALRRLRPGPVPLAPSILFETEGEL